MRGSEHIDRIVAYLREHGAADISVEMGGKHPHIYYRWNGAEHVYVTAGSLSDWRGTMNAITDLRHKLGLVRGEKRVGERRERRRRADRGETTPPALTALGDPFAVLRMHKQFEGRWRQP